MVTSFASAIFNPSFPVGMGHMILASLETSAFAVAGISAVFLLKDRDAAFYRRSMGIALLMAALLAPLQIYVGDANGREVYRSQPAKLAGIEGLWETNTDRGAALNLFALPDMKGERNLFQVSIPDALSLLVTHSARGTVRGLKEFPREDRPNSLILFWAFRIMAGIGFLFFFVMIWAAALWKRGRLFEYRPFLWTLVALQPLGWLATETGWIVTEVGRQPWLVYGLLRTREGLSPIPAGNVVWSLSLFSLIFLAVGGSYFYYVLKVLNGGPDMTGPPPPVRRRAGMRTPRGPGREDRP